VCGRTRVNPFRKGRRWGVLAVVGLGLLTLSWVYSTVPWWASDETSHYLRALSLSNGTLLGPKLTFHRVKAPPGEPQWQKNEQVAFVNGNRRETKVTAAMAPPGMHCLNGLPTAKVASCLVKNPVGAYQPLPYLLPALALRVSSHVSAALYLARLASALQNLVFIGLAVWLLWAGSAWSVLGLVAALTPEVFFITSILNPNGFVIASNLTFLSALIRISRSPFSASRWVWTVAAVSGACTILGWQLGWVFVAGDIGAVTLVLVGRNLRALVARRRHELTVLGAVLLIAVGIYYAYAIYAGNIKAPFHITPFVTGLQDGWGTLLTQLTGSVLLAGDISVGLPGLQYYWIYFAPVLLIILAALALTNNRTRITLVLVLLGSFAFPVLFFAWVYRFTGFGLQPRYVMPVLTLIPVISGEVLFRARHRIPRPIATVALLVLFGYFVGYQLYAWYVNATYNAGINAGTQNSPFSLPSWIPPDGWTLWATLAGCGALAILASLASTLVPRNRRTGGRLRPDGLEEHRLVPRS
jgi:Predicted membrane protein (DUF2142)